MENNSDTANEFLQIGELYKIKESEDKNYYPSTTNVWWVTNEDRITEEGFILPEKSVLLYLGKARWVMNIDGKEYYHHKFLWKNKIIIGSMVVDLFPETILKIAN